MGAQLEIANSQKIHKEIFEIELNTSQTYIDNLLDKAIKQLSEKQNKAISNLDNIFTLVTENGSIGLNLDTLETGVIDIAALVGILVFTGKDFLGSILEERRTNIIQSLENAENRLKEADRRFNEAQKQLSQANILISKIKREAVESQK